MREQAGHVDEIPWRPEAAVLTDPVCGMEVESDSLYRARYRDDEFVFCSSACRERYVAALDAVFGPVGGRSSSALRSDEGPTLYTCPMHPEIIRQEPGMCPKCGNRFLSGPGLGPVEQAGDSRECHEMPLEPVRRPQVATTSTEPRRFHMPWMLGFCLFLAIALFFLWEEHRAHILGALPFALLLACPVIHLFMHRGHGGHGNGRHEHEGHAAHRHEGDRP